MKKSPDFVSRGRDEARVPEAPAKSGPAAWEYAYEPPLTAAMPAHLLPRDYGVRGECGAVEEAPLAQTVPAALAALEEQLGVSPEEQLVQEVLSRLVPQAAERNLIQVRQVTRYQVVLAVPRVRLYPCSTTLVPQLRAALRPKMGAVMVRLESL